MLVTVVVPQVKGDPTVVTTAVVDMMTDVTEPELNAVEVLEHGRPANEAGRMAFSFSSSSASNVRDGEHTLIGAEDRAPEQTGSPLDDADDE